MNLSYCLGSNLVQIFDFCKKKKKNDTSGGLGFIFILGLSFQIRFKCLIITTKCISIY